MKSGVSRRRNSIVSRAPYATLSFCKVVWRRYLGEVGKFNPTVWLIYPGHCTPISIKIGQHLLKLCTKVFWCVFYAPQCMYAIILCILVHFDDEPALPFSTFVNTFLSALMGRGRMPPYYLFSSVALLSRKSLYSYRASTAYLYTVNYLSHTRSQHRFAIS